MTHEQRLEAARAWNKKNVTERADLEQRLAAATERMQVIANLFSATAWNLLPPRVKELLQEYRN